MCFANTRVSVRVRFTPFYIYGYGVIGNVPALGVGVMGSSPVILKN